MNGRGANPVVEFFRCSPWFGDAQIRVDLHPDLAVALASAQSKDPLWREPGERWLTNSRLKQWVDLLRYEHYDQASTETTVGAIFAREAYYAIRPLLGVTVRRHLQGFALRGWDKRPFPRWPVDRTVDELLETSLAAIMKQKCVREVPFIWFWPKGYSSCALLTHDVETKDGLQFCPTLMDLDDAAGIKSAFQIVPEQRYEITQRELEQFRDRGFEVNIHDLNHDGHLFRDRRKFDLRVQKINEYGRRFGASGFRAGALYRNQDWFDGLQFAYDMSVPNVAHLDPQHGGCCTMFPYFVGDVLELPVTAIQDYSLFHVLRTYSTELWRTQMSYIVEHHGLINVITHPDYVIEQRARDSYKELLDYLNDLRTNSGVWIAQPREVNAWWRERSDMKLVWDSDRWTVVGPGSERAAVAYFEVDGDRPEYRVDDRVTVGVGEKAE
jgi:hypothetical protein